MGQGNIFRSVCPHSVHGGACMVAPGGACMAKGGCAWRRGACMAKGGWCAWRRGACVAKGGRAWRRGGACVACTPPRDTAGHCAGGTHPTGMHSCTLFYFDMKRNYSQESYLKLQQYGFLHKRPIWFCATSELLFVAALRSLAELFRDPTVHLTRPQMSTFFHHLQKRNLWSTVFKWTHWKSSGLGTWDGLVWDQNKRDSITKFSEKTLEKSKCPTCHRNSMWSTTRDPCDLPLNSSHFLGNCGVVCIFR